MTRNLKLGRLALMAFALAAVIATGVGGCGRFAAADADHTAGDTRRYFALVLPEAAPQWNRAYQRALRERLEVLAQRDDATSQLDIVRLQPLLDGYYSALPANLRRERDRALARAQALAAPGDDSAFWLQATICTGHMPDSAQPCDPDSALAHLQRSDPDNAAVWLMTLEAAAARGDQAGVDAALSRAAQARRYDIRYGAGAMQILRALDAVDLPALDEPALAVLNADGKLAGSDLRDARMALAGWAFALPAPLAFQAQCRTAAAAAATAGGQAAGERRAACLASAALLAESDTMLGRMFGLTLMAQLTAQRADGPVWRERLRVLYWQNQQSGEVPALSREMAQVWQAGEMVTVIRRLREAGRERPPAGWLPASEPARSWVTRGHYIEPPSAPAPARTQ